ncbi:hypothetical protein LCGC14_2024310 [marine sediment metagenome]|uniref:(E)-4-hydroxy-3-methylbut-2-enyl-diphosphate synthase (ferredoxin) n=1 Tax=marine sediment metagenome TaxID=412755 RepID=A0A0F9H9Z3_9ZZZZ|nr:4-hydroxy-3-methylbut-2-en-1-yl diphosphate synthase [bacterium]
MSVEGLADAEVDMQYCDSLTQYTRFKSREVSIGDVPLGASNPIRIQSMTTTDTMDTKATVAQTIRLAEAGCDYVRITAPSINEANNLEIIKKELHQSNCKVPLIVDIHYTPNAAELAARIVEKVRVNPGNYVDKKKFEVREYDDKGYQAELDRIRERFTPLVMVCKEYGTAMRIGTNHGSLSDRIMNRYGDTPLGMVESALEFVTICEDLGYQDIVLSMKASNPQVMVQAYRLLVNKMIATGRNYPLHIGVTEAGDGMDGRIKSAMGIGSLLEDGLGDTVRVSLTEKPEAEVPIAKMLVERYGDRANHEKIQEIVDYPIDPFTYNKRDSIVVGNIGGDNVPRIVADYSLITNITSADFDSLGYNYSKEFDKWNLSEMACDYVFLGDKVIDFEIPGTLGLVYNYKTWLRHKAKERVYPFIQPVDYLKENYFSNKVNFVYATLSDLDNIFIKKLKDDPTAVLWIDTYNKHGMVEQRRLFVELMNKDCRVPVIIGRAYKNLSEDQLMVDSATDMGGLLLDGLGDGIFIAAENCGPDKKVNETVFGILQATRTRISKTEYISCPSCGRTLFDLEVVTEEIRKRTNHLKGVKIGIMGCIVNGPGEMADADFGYVGSGPGKITLYKGKEVVKKGIDENIAVDELIELIKTDGKWVDYA